MSVYHRKLYALLQNPQKLTEGDEICQKLTCMQSYLEEIRSWWENQGHNLPVKIASSSDRINLEPHSRPTNSANIEIRHPISGQKQYLSFDRENDRPEIPPQINDCEDVEQVYWWFWRFYPEIKAKHQANFLLQPAFETLPDCPLHSYQTTVSALVGAMYPESWSSEEKHEHPYLILFTFSPIQEFIKASRKFLDFWAGSYLLHYLSAKLCWYIAEKYGADAVITPSLWSQEIIDALLVEQNPDFTSYFEFISQDESSPIARFENKKSTSLATAGFPNVITALVPGKEAAEQLGKELTEELKKEWYQISVKVRENIKKTVIDSINTDKKFNDLWSKISNEFNSEKYQQEIKKWQQGGCWTWNSLWNVQIGNPKLAEDETKRKLKGDTWETYWTAVPLGNPDRNLLIEKQQDFEQWKKDQDSIARPRFIQDIPTPTERDLYQEFNVGTWWGSFQARLGQLIQSVKNTRSWQIATAPGERSSLSGQYTALHPQQLYRDNFREGGGLPASSLRLFWRVMAEVYPGLFNGSEMLNAIELTKRMAWQYGGVAESLGINVEQSITQINRIHDSETEQDYYVPQQTNRLDYEKLIRFPNLSSIAAARFVYEHQDRARQYWRKLKELINQKLPEYKDQFGSRTRGRPFHILNTDQEINPRNLDGQNFNGVMFSSKWLADDMALEREQTNILRGLVDQGHRDSGLTNGSPADWWVIVLGDGDGMGKYVSGSKLGVYEKYIVDEKVALEVKNHNKYQNLLQNTKKRMGPATHVALNRALLDFSNRLVPYITERRFCGKVVYSGGDDVMAVLPLADLPEFLLSLRAAWSGKKDPAPEEEFKTNQAGIAEDELSGYWHPKKDLPGIPNRSLFTMGEDATMSLGIVIAYKSVPLPTVLETLWTAEKEKAKKMPGVKAQEGFDAIPVKDGLCFRVIYGSGNVLEALMKGHLLSAWWDFVQEVRQKNQKTAENGEATDENRENIDLSSLLYRLAEDLPKHTAITKSDRLIAKAATVIINRRDQKLSQELKDKLAYWLEHWEDWAYHANPNYDKDILGTKIEDLSKLLRFTAFWLDKMAQFDEWVEGGDES